MIRPRSLLLGALCWAAAPVAVRADANPAPRPADFAYAIPILIAGNEAFHGFRLPAAVYRGLTRADRGDLRVFDAQDRVMQHALNVRPDVPAEQAAPPAPIALPLFPLPVADAAAGSGAALHVRVDAHGGVVEVTGAPAAAPAAARYLLDASALGTRVAALRFVWADSPRPLVVALRLECSGDLEHWRNVAVSALADLRAGGHRVRQDTVELPAVACRYLRFGWPAEATLERVEATPASTGSVPPPAPMERLTIEGRQGEDGAWTYDTGGRFPVRLLDFEFPGPNTVFEASVAVRDSATAPWREIHRGLVYDYDAAGRKLRSRPIALPATPVRYWRVQAVRPESAPATAPQLKLGWQGDPLIFVNSGVPPYRLAYGSLKVRPSGTSIASLFGTQPPPVTPARLGEQTQLAGPAALGPPPPAVPWQRYGLWLVLLAGVVGLGRMGLKLWKEMGRPA